jgi:transcriptional regulator with XRE-family HTH domain
MFVTSPTDHSKAVGARLRELRLQRNITQQELSTRAGVTAPTLRALEHSGRGTLETLARVMYALGREREIDELLAPDPPSSLEDVVAPKRRRRARR